MRRAVAAAVAALSVVVVAGCGSGPGQVGSAAIVGDTAIPVEYVQTWWDEYTSDPQRKANVAANDELDVLGRVIASASVQHEIISKVGAAENLRFDEAQVSEVLDELGGAEAAVQSSSSIYDATRVRERLRDQLVVVALARKHMDGSSVRYGYTTVESRQQAEDKVREIATAGVDGAAALFEADAAAGIEAVGDVEQAAGTDPEAVATSALFRAPAGTVVAWQLQGAAATGQWRVALVREHVTDGRPDGTRASELGEADLFQIGLALLAWHARDIDVRLNPRYGVWDPIFLDVRPTEGERLAISMRAAPGSNA